MKKTKRIVPILLALALTVVGFSVLIGCSTPEEPVDSIVISPTTLTFEKGYRNIFVSHDIVHLKKLDRINFILKRKAGYDLYIGSKLKSIFEAANFQIGHRAT